MRISAKPDHVDFNHYALFASVTLNDITLHNCILADEEKGLVICYDHSLPYLDGQVQTVTQHGKVIISFDNVPKDVNVNEHFPNRRLRLAK